MDNHDFNIGDKIRFQIGDLKTLDWCYVNHIDYRGLIPMGLAKDATNSIVY